VALFVACTGSAAAQNGAGLYEPFPQPAAPSVSRDFIEQLRPPGPRLASSLTPGELERGARVPRSAIPGGEALPAVVDPAPSGRADPGRFAASMAGWLGVVALLALGVAGTRRLTVA
jgi:hypothetical protein